MSGIEIKQEIEKLNEELAQHRSITFTLNNEVKDILERIYELQAQCAHEFNEDGVCIYCGVSK